MAIVYNIYANGGAGGPVNFTTPIATTTSLSYVTGMLPAGSDTTFAVRAKDTASNLEEANTDACVRVALDANGNDIGGRPNPPHALLLSTAAGGGCLVSWAYFQAAGSATPVGFQVFLSEGSSALFGSLASTVPYVYGQVGYICRLPGPYVLSTYSASVRAYNAAGSDGNTIVVGAIVGVPTSPVIMEPISVSFV
jgi:hypothetical protein